MRISPLQTIDQKYWSGLTTDNHFGLMYQLQPQLMSNTIDTLYSMTIGGDDIVNFIKRFPYVDIQDDSVPYEWLLYGSDERAVSLVGVYQSDLSTSYTTGAAVNCGLGLTTFWMVFPERFEISSVLAGPFPETYQPRVISEPKAFGNNWAHECQLMGADETLSMPVDVIAAGTTWMSDYGLTEQTLSRRGNTVSHAAPFRMRNITSMIRKNYEVPGNMILKGTKNCPLAFGFIDAQGNKQVGWIDKLTWDFYVQTRRDIARIITYGKSNMFPDGTFKHYGESGHVIRQGHGLYAQRSTSNVEYYNTFSLDGLVDFGMNLTFGKVPEDKRELVLESGERGIVQFCRSIEDKAGGIPMLNNLNRIIAGGKNNSEMTLSGVFTGYVTVRGLKFYVMYNPMMDNYTRFQNHLHPNGGVVESYKYNIWDCGTTSGKSNIQLVRLNGMEERLIYRPGLRSPFDPGFGPITPKTSPILATSPVDGYCVDWAWWGGVQLVNPVRTGGYWPTISVTG